MDSITKSLIKEKEDAIVLEVKRQLGVDVDRGELLQALQYDRFQYDKGYDDGHRDAMDKLVRCKDCKHYYHSEKEIGWRCELDKQVWHKYDFCSYGERKDGE